MRNFIIFILLLIGFHEGECIAQGKFNLSVGTEINFSIVNLDKRVLTFGQFHEIQGKPRLSIFLNSGIKLSKRVSINTRIMYYINELEYQFTDMLDPTEGFQDYATWHVNTTIKEKGISLGPGISYSVSDMVFVGVYFSYSRILSSKTESKYTTVEVPFEVSGTEKFNATYEQFSTIYQIGYKLRRVMFTLSSEVYLKEREISFPLNFTEPRGREVRFMFGVAYNFQQNLSVIYV